MNRRLAALLFIVFSIGSNAFAKDGDYAVSKIAENLLKNADAVMRLEETRFEIISTKEAIERQHYVITILNENGDDWAAFSEYYDKLREVSFVDGVLYDANGVQLKKTKNKDIQDVSGVDDNNLIDDNRVKYHNFYYKAYPYTVEYTVEIKHRNTLFFPRWMPQRGSKVSVEQSSMIIECADNYPFRYKAYNYPGDPVIVKEKNKKLSTWSAKNMNALLREPYQPAGYELTTVVSFGPADFQVGEYKGNMATWQDFIKFQLELNKGKDVLPASVKQKVLELTNGVTDPRKKIQILYEFLQKNTRYISIQLGVGGWQPFEASYVANKGYGDCKALTNYMYSLLKEAGITSYYTLIRAGQGQRPVPPDFPSAEFNHVILCAMAGKDSVWLECTSQTMPAGYLGDFTSNRYGLLIDATVGKLVRTPRYGLNENLQVRHIKGKLEDDATLLLNTNSRYEAEQQDDVQGMINYLSKDKVKEYLHKQFDFGTYDITSFNYKENKSELPSVDEQLDISVSNYATITGKRLFIVPNVMTRHRQRLKEDTARKYDVELNFAYRDIDSVEIELPAGYELESKPTDANISNKFGKYSSTVKLSGNKLYYYRLMEQYSGRFPAKEYNELVKFYEAVYKSDRNKVVLVKKE